MLTHENLYVFLYALPIYQLLFYTVQLVTLKKSNPSRRYFGLLMLNLTIVLIISAIHHLGYAQWMATLFIVFAPLILTLLPVFLLYFHSLTNGKLKTNRLWLIALFIPPLLILILNLFSFGISPLQDRLLFASNQFSSLNSSNAALHFAELVFKFGVPCFLIIQVVWASVKIRSLLHAETDSLQKDPGRFAYLQTTWIKIIFISLVGFIPGILLSVVLFADQPMVSAVIFNIILLASGGLAGYLGMKQDTLLIQVATLERPPLYPVSWHDQLLQKEEVRLQQQISSPPLIQLEEAERIINQLQLLMQSKKPYLDSHYSLDDLCKHMDVPRRFMTYVLNDVMGKNFYGVVNEYRMQDAIKIMENDGKKYTIEAIAEQVGFSSKSSFYACFRKYTGITPKEYLANK